MLAIHERSVERDGPTLDHRRAAFGSDPEHPNRLADRSPRAEGQMTRSGRATPRDLSRDRDRGLRGSLGDPEGRSGLAIVACRTGHASGAERWERIWIAPRSAGPRPTVGKGNAEGEI